MLHNYISKNIVLSSNSYMHVFIYDRSKIIQTAFMVKVELESMVSRFLAGALPGARPNLSNLTWCAFYI